jgi:steroid 5-alpha reductase family enzyme
MFHFFEMIGSAFFSALFVMSGCFTVYFFQRKAQVVDLGWCLSFLLIGVFYFLIGEGLFIRRFLLLIALTLWFGRLLFSISGRYRGEDPRYTKIISGWIQENILFKVFSLFLFQGMLTVILSFPFLLIASNRGEFSWFEIAGGSVWFLGFFCQALSDETLKEFKKHSNLVCKEGFWRFSRHPNYFFEWVMWIGAALAAYPVRFGYLAVISPLLMYYLLRYVSGVPFAEAQSLSSKGDLYREYQEETSEFFPWFLKRD